LWKRGAGLGRSSARGSLSRDLRRSRGCSARAARLERASRRGSRGFAPLPASIRPTEVSLLDSGGRAPQPRSPFLRARRRFSASLIHLDHGDPASDPQSEGGEAGVWPLPTESSSETSVGLKMAGRGAKPARLRTWRNAPAEPRRRSTHETLAGRQTATLGRKRPSPLPPRRPQRTIASYEPGASSVKSPRMVLLASSRTRQRWVTNVDSVFALPALTVP
jgi:hypothetical protein